MRPDLRVGWTFFGHRSSTTFPSDSNIQEAQDAALEGARHEPESPRLQDAVGDCYLRLGRNEAALRYYQRAAALEEDKPAYSDFPGRIPFRLSTALRCLGRFQEALIPLRESIRREPKNAFYHNALGVLLGDGLKDYPGAVRALKKAIELDPEMKSAPEADGIYYFNAALYLLELSEHQEARIHIDRALSFRPQDSRYNKLSRDVEAAIKQKGSAPRPKPPTLPSALGDACQAALKIARRESKAAGRQAPEPAHLFIALCKLCDTDLAEFLDSIGADGNKRAQVKEEVGSIAAAFLEAALDVKKFRRRLRAAMTGRAAAAPEAFQALLDRAEGYRHLGLEDRTTIKHLLRILLETGGEDAPWTPIFDQLGIDRAKLLQGTAREPKPAKKEPEAPKPAPKPILKEDVCQAVPTPTLDKFSRDLSRLVREDALDPFIGRKAEIKRLAQVLIQKRKNSAILVGEAGIGKTRIVEGLAQRLAAPDAPAALKRKRIVELELAALIAGTDYRGTFEERLQGILKEAALSKDLVVFIDEIHTLVGAGRVSGSALDAGNILKPALARGDFQCIGATTPEEYRKHVEKDPALARRFELIEVEEPSAEEAVEILKGLKKKFEEYHGVDVTDEAVQAAVELSVRYLADLKLPDKAIDLIDQACARARLASTSNHAAGAPSVPEAIGREEVAAVVARRCRIPVQKLTAKEADRYLRMEEALKKRVIGQDDAVREVCEVVRTARAGLKDPRKPVGVFLFLGPTGVGKTELAKALAEFLFDDDGRLLRFDMSEYIEKHSVSKLIGSPPGYIGSEEEGQLTGKVRARPHCVVLFDEIEKAHPEINDIFLQIFDEGVLTGANGKKTSFSEAVIILTSNLGGARDNESSERRFEAGPKAIADILKRQEYLERVREALAKHFRPELLNRINKKVIFNPIGREEAEGIVLKLAVRLQKRLADKGFGLELSLEARRLILQRGFSEAFGARELERAVEALIAEPLAKELLRNRFSSGAAILADRKGDRIVFAEGTGPSADAGADGRARTAGTSQRKVIEAILVMDICDSTAMGRKIGDPAMVRVKRAIKEIAEKEAKGRKALYIKGTGDGFLMTFAAPGDALRAALQILRRVGEFNREKPEVPDVFLRFGADFGEVYINSEGDRLGNVVNLAFRVEGTKAENRIEGKGATEPLPLKDRILVTERVLAAPGVIDEEDFLTREIGSFLYKGFEDEPQRICALLTRRPGAESL